MTKNGQKFGQKSKEGKNKRQKDKQRGQKSKKKDRQKGQQSRKGKKRRKYTNTDRQKEQKTNSKSQMRSELITSFCMRLCVAVESKKKKTFFVKLNFVFI